MEFDLKSVYFDLKNVDFNLKFYNLIKNIRFKSKEMCKVDTLMVNELGSWVQDLHILNQIIHFLDLILLFLNTEFCTSNIISAQNLGILSVICRIGSKIFVFKNKHF